MKSINLLNDLINRTKNNIKRVENLTQLTQEQLNYKPTSKVWSVLECIEHLNLYGDFYLPEIETQINSSTFSFSNNFKSGFFGNYFAKSMLPKKKLNKMKTFKDKNPSGSSLNTFVLNRFILQQEKLLLLLEKAKNINLNKTKTAISITKLLKLKLGDTFRVVIYHNERHILQAERIIA